MLYESDVINAVCDYLTDIGFDVDQKLNEYQHGDDIIASKNYPEPITIRIEAKGETSSKRNSSRFGKPFTRSQVRVHVAMAFYKAAEVLSRDNTSIGTYAGIGFPENDAHRDLVCKIGSGIEKMGIIVFWVDGDRNVTVENRPQSMNS